MSLLPILILVVSFSTPALLGQDLDRPIFTSDVNTVVIYATVYDEDGQLYSDLKAEDFRIYEDGVQQRVTYFGLDDIPSTIGIVMDSSGSMRSKKDLVDEATELFLAQSHPENELFLIDFNDEVMVEEDFTREVEDIKDALFNLINSGGTSLYDAIYLAGEHAQEGAEPKRAIVVFTDGEDQDSYYAPEELLEKVREDDVQIHIVAFLDADLKKRGGFFGVFRSKREKITEQITELADVTGGKAFFPTDRNELNGIFEQIARELRNQYRLAYVPTRTERDGAWRRIDVEIVNARERELRIRARKGYYAR